MSQLVMPSASTTFFHSARKKDPGEQRLGFRVGTLGDLLGGVEHPQQALLIRFVDADEAAGLGHRHRLVLVLFGRRRQRLLQSRD